VFEKLKLDVQSDAKSRTQILMENRAVYGFATAMNGNSISVFLKVSSTEPPHVGRSITFRIVGYRVEVSDQDGKVLIKATLTMNDGGECLIKIADKGLTFWQLRKLALEDLFFNSWGDEAQ